MMRRALAAAAAAATHGDVPIGAVIARDDEVIAEAGNERELRRDPTAHAELLALREAAAALGGWRIPEATLYVTLEPCAMCAGAIVLARVPRVVYATADPIEGHKSQFVDDQARNYSKRVLGTFFTYSWLYEDAVPEIPNTIPPELIPKK